MTDGPSRLNPSEELHQLVLSNISDAVFITDDAGRFTYICPNVNTIFGYSQAEVDALGNIRGLLGEFGLDRARLAAEGELENVERNVQDKGGGAHALLVNVKRVSIGDGTILFTCRDVTERRKIEEALFRSERRLRALGRQLVAAQEEERARISRELHDEAGQGLTALKIHLQLIEGDLPADHPELHRRLAEAVALTDGAMERVRLLVQDLRPPALDAVGLNGALEGLCRNFEAHTHLHVAYEGADLSGLADAAQLCLYRFLQEGLTNAARHAGVEAVRVRLGEEGRDVVLTVADRGRGFDPSGLPAVPRDGRGLGLAGMRERLELLRGRLTVDSAPGRGTRVEARVPAGRSVGRGARKSKAEY